MPKAPQKKKTAVALRLSPEDIEVTSDGLLKINHKGVADTLRRMIQSAKEKEAKKGGQPTAVRVSA